MPLFRISHGMIYDPANGINGVVQDIWIQDAKIISPPATPDVRLDKMLDATGLVIMPGSSVHSAR